MSNISEKDRIKRSIVYEFSNLRSIDLRKINSNRILLNNLYKEYTVLKEQIKLLKLIKNKFYLDKNYYFSNNIENTLLSKHEKSLSLLKDQIEFTVDRQRVLKRKRKYLNLCCETIVSTNREV